MTAYARCTDLIDTIDNTCRDDNGTTLPVPECEALRWMVVALVRVLNNHPTIAEGIEADLVRAAEALELEQ